MSTEITRDLLIDTMQRAYTRRGDVTERARLGAQADAILTLLAEHDRQVAERAWDEAVNASVLHYVPPSGLYSGVSWPANPYRRAASAATRVCVCNVGAQECPVHPGRVRTKEEKIAFRKNWDAKVERQ